MNSDTAGKVTLVLKTGLFNDAELVEQAMQHMQTDDITIIDIGQEATSNFTDSGWDDVVNAILTSEKIITV